MQAPTYAEFETFRKVSAWISANASALSRVEDTTIQSPLDIF